MKRILVLFIILILFTNLPLAMTDEISQLIDQLKRPQDYSSFEDYHNNVVEKLIEIGSPAVDPAIQLFTGAFNDEQVENAVPAQAALYVIARIRDKQASGTLINLLNGFQYIHFYADIIQVLGALQDTGAFESIASKYEEYKDVQGFDAERITSEAYYALTILGDPRALPIFRKKAEEYPSEGGRSAGRGAIMHLARKFAETNNQAAIESLKDMLGIGLKVTITLNEEYTSEKFNEEIKDINWIREEVVQALRKLGVEVKAEKYEYDTTPPTVRIISPQDGVSVPGEITILTEATDDLSGIDEVEFFKDGQRFGYKLEPPYSREWNTTIYPVGSRHRLQAKATDFAGNIGESEVITVVISEDTTPPTTTDNYQYNNIWINFDANITLTATDDVSGVAHTYYLIDGVQYEGTTIAIVEEGQRTVTYWSVDNTGNTESPHTIGVWIDKTPPEVSISTEPSILWPVNKKQVQVTINGTSADTLSRISSKVFTVSDEYNEVKTSLSDFGQAIELIAWRTGDDKDGRIYTVKVVVMDKAGNSTIKETLVTVPHDMGE